MTSSETHRAHVAALDAAMDANDHAAIAIAANTILDAPTAATRLVTKTGLRQLLSAMRRDPNLNVREWDTLPIS